MRRLASSSINSMVRQRVRRAVPKQEMCLTRCHWRTRCWHRWRWRSTSLAMAYSYPHSGTLPNHLDLDLDCHTIIDSRPISCCYYFIDWLTAFRVFSTQKWNSTIQAAFNVWKLFRDEIYMTVCKQLVRNPYRQSIDRGWLLLHVITSIFLPDSDEVTYLLVT